MYKYDPMTRPGHPSIYGSDVNDWSQYSEIARVLPDLRLPVDSFEQFCLLLQKDPTTINTVLDQKTSEDIDLQPFGDDSSLKIRAFDDITVDAWALDSYDDGGVSCWPWGQPSQLIRRR